ncbi:unnamed protein product [Closterium sp. Naga37s-1]|nr:unnamed protein product [Closterium sp. Naga37s-1]
MATEPHGRYLFAGDVEGRLHLLFKRAAAVNKSNGPFDCLFCVGAFFPPADPATAGGGGAGGQSELEDYIAGRAKAPLPTFLIGDIGVGAQRLLEIAERGGGGAATRKEGEAGEEKGKEEGKEEQKEEVEEGGKGEGEEKGEGEDKGEGEEKGKGEEAPEGEGDGSKAVGEAGEAEESKGEVGAGRQGGGSGGGEKEEDEEVGEGEWRSHRRVKICDNIEWLRGAGIADLCGQIKPSPLCLPAGSNPPYLSSTPPLPSLFRPTGLKVAYLGGRYDPATYLSKQGGGTGAAEGRQERAAVEALVDAGADGAAIDMLLTNEWPKGVAALTHPSLLPTPPPATSASAPASVDWAGVGSPVAATLAKELMPRYHVAGGAGFFFARPPYINSATSAEDASTSASGPVTRFIGLAPVGNKAKQKFLHALSLRSASSLPLSDLAAQPPDATPSPFLPRPSSAKNQIWTGSLAAPDGAARAAAAAAQAKAEETAAKRTFWESSDGGKGGGEGAVKPAWALKVEEEEARGVGGAGDGEQYWRYAAGKKRVRRDGGPGGGGGGREGREGPQRMDHHCLATYALSTSARAAAAEGRTVDSDTRWRMGRWGEEGGEGQGGGDNAAAGSVAAAVATAAAVAAAAGVGPSSGGPSELPKGVCFDFVRRGSCTRGDTCRFAHSLPSTSPGLLGTPPPLTPASLAALLAPHAGPPPGGATGGAAAGGVVPPAPAPCWFCLASPKVETHLVVSVGEHCYVALPKGPLVPGHVLILPIEHFPSVISLPSDALAEMWRYMGALRRCFEAQGQTVVAFERFLQLRAATHAHVNVSGSVLDDIKQISCSLHVMPPPGKGGQGAPCLLLMWLRPSPASNAPSNPFLPTPGHLVTRSPAPLLPHCSLLFPRCPLLTPLPPLPTAHSSSPAAHCSLLFPRCPLLTPLPPLPTAHSSSPAAHCSLLFPRCPLLTPLPPLPTAHSSSPAAHCSLLFPRCPLLTPLPPLPTVHAWQVVPIPQDKADQVLPAFTAAASSHNFQFATVPKPPEGQHMDEVKKQSRGGQYLTVELPDGSLLVHAIDRGAKLPMQLGREVRRGWGEREVVAGVVGLPERGDWRACKETAEEEAAMADAFKKQFQPFDIMG